VGYGGIRGMGKEEEEGGVRRKMEEQKGCKEG